MWEENQIAAASIAVRPAQIWKRRKLHFAPPTLAPFEGAFANP